MTKVFATVDISSVFSPAGVAGFTDFGKIISIVITNLYVLAGLIALFFLIFGGFMFIVGAGGGDGKRLEQGKKTLTGAIMGLVVILFSIWIIQIIELVTGIKILSSGL